VRQTDPRMKFSFWHKPLLLWILLLCAPVYAKPQNVPDTVITALKSRGPVVLSSIYPKRTGVGEEFLGFPILGQVELAPEESVEIAESVLTGLVEADAAAKQNCFAPRHALTISDRKFLICYACHTALVEVEEGRKVKLAITESGHAELAQAVYDHGLGWQGWQPVGDELRHESGLALTVPTGYTAQVSAGTDSLDLRSRADTVQQEERPGRFLFENEETGEVVTVPTSWLDHSTTDRPVWYLLGRTGTFDSARNERRFRGSAFELARIQAFLKSADQPSRRVVRILVRPLEDESELQTQIHKLRRKGYELEESEVDTHRFKTARFREAGTEIEIFVGSVSTAQGPVLVRAEVPGDIPNPLPDLIRNLVRVNSEQK